MMYIRFVVSCKFFHLFFLLNDPTNKNRPLVQVLRDSWIRWTYKNEMRREKKIFFYIEQIVFFVVVRQQQKKTKNWIKKLTEHLSRWTNETEQKTRGKKQKSQIIVMMMMMRFLSEAWKSAGIIIYIFNELAMPRSRWWWWWWWWEWTWMWFVKWTKLN